MQTITLTKSFKLVYNIWEEQRNVRASPISLNQMIGQLKSSPSNNKIESQTRAIKRNQTHQSLDANVKLVSNARHVLSPCIRRWAGREFPACARSGRCRAGCRRSQWTSTRSPLGHTPPAPAWRRATFKTIASVSGLKQDENRRGKRSTDASIVRVASFAGLRTINRARLIERIRSVI